MFLHGDDKGSLQPERNIHLSFGLTVCLPPAVQRLSQMQGVISGVRVTSQESEDLSFMLLTSHLEEM